MVETDHDMTYKTKQKLGKDEKTSEKILHGYHHLLDV